MQLALILPLVDKFYGQAHEDAENQRRNKDQEEFLARNFLFAINE
ncbi:MAG TPA: hypothetical protein VGR43_01680 [Dehalococcoidia bacterium]|nr:hypothetical protein [Dehalococcoidia bacterium]